MTNYDILKEYEEHKTPVPSYGEYKTLKKQLAIAVEENKRYYDALYTIQFTTAALGGNEEDKDRALADIDNICNWALRPEEMKEMEWNWGSEKTKELEK